MTASPAPRPAGGATPSVVFALLTVQVLFGLHYVAGKVVLEHVTPPAWAVVRVASAAALMHVLTLGRSWTLRPRGREWASCALFAVFGVVLNQVLFVEGLSRTTPAHSALVNTTIPLWTVAFAALLGREALTRRRSAGLLLGLLGAWILLRADRYRVDLDLLPGDLLTACNAASFGLFLVLSRDYLRRHDPLVTVAWVFTLGAPLIALYGAPAMARQDWGGLSSSTWALAAFIVIGPTVGTYFLNYWALARVASSLVALFVYLQPVVATAVQWAGLGQHPGPRFAVAAALIFAGIALASWRRAPAQEPPEGRVDGGLEGVSDVADEPSPSQVTR